MAFKCKRWTVANMLPVGFVLWVILTVSALYVSMHLLFLLEVWKPELPAFVVLESDPTMHKRGVVQSVVMSGIMFMVMMCLHSAMFTDPGSVPETPKWMLEPSGNAPQQHEKKLAGGRRFCKWCNCYKPDRSHHCRVCRSCVLRMDHHCPWIANCIGFHNHKYFLLLVIYSLLGCIFISATMVESLHQVLYEEGTFLRRFLVIFCMTLCFMVESMLGIFLAVHVWLMLNAMTTIEFCEKAYRRQGIPRGRQASMYNCGVYNNLTSVLGPNPLCWFLPCKLPEGDGLHFHVNFKCDSIPSENNSKSLQAAGVPPSEACETSSENHEISDPLYEGEQVPEVCNTRADCKDEAPPALGSVPNLGAEAVSEKK